MDYIDRGLANRFSDTGDSREVTLIEGARQVGKTTLLKHLGEDTDRLYADLGDPRVRILARTDPAAFLERFPPPLVLEGMHHAPELVPVIAEKVTEDQTPDMFWISGSYRAGAIEQLGEELGERLETVHMQGLSQREKAGLPPERFSFVFEDLVERAKSLEGIWGPDDVAEHIWNGGLPAMQFEDGSAEDLRPLFDPYVETYILRDVSYLAGIRDLQRFSRFLHACAARISYRINYKELANEADITIPTAHSWVNLLEELGLVYVLRPFTSGRFNRLGKTPKLYFTDTGLAAFLCGWLNSAELMGEASAGAFFENYAIMELISSLEADGELYNLSYFRDGNAVEIDLILERGNDLHPINIRFSGPQEELYRRQFKSFRKRSGVQSLGGVICHASEPAPLGDMDSLIPGFII